MSEEAFGKIFQTAEEASLQPLSDEERAAERRMFDEARARWHTTPPADPASIPERFHDDYVGTDHEGRTYDPQTRQWYDELGRLGK
ncbi:hypothetical protein [Nocardia camponoti]|uniref:Uncharacterized protein n=1 Tax=Nocardia camponoti TaxID=1616106 RepID=A0A917QHE0_9NOCA|nr:hypothetical protein [Nocardia camponoti]GGK50843.1 hypothetical protein GCM10011591_22990 [Nocardia camponoti]